MVCIHAGTPSSPPPSSITATVPQFSSFRSTLQGFKRRGCAHDVLAYLPHGLICGLCIMVYVI